MKILYLHGLESKLSPEKREILEKYGEVVAPDVDYYQDPKAIENLLKKYAGLNIDAVVGSSMGGFAGYHISNRLDRPALLFNPALKRRSVKQELPAEISASKKLKQIIIGEKDEVVKPAETLEFISSELYRGSEFYIHLRPGMEHRTPVEIFEEELDSFFAKIRNQQQ